jgi:amino acid transporter
MLEFGSSIPISGGMKVYMERSFSPKLLMTCIYLFYCVFLRELFGLFVCSIVG